MGRIVADLSIVNLILSEGLSIYDLAGLRQFNRRSKSMISEAKVRIPACQIASTEGERLSEMLPHMDQSSDCPCSPSVGGLPCHQLIQYSGDGIVAGLDEGA